MTEYFDLERELLVKPLPAIGEGHGPTESEQMEVLRQALALIVAVWDDVESEGAMPVDRRTRRARAARRLRAAS